MRAMGPRLRLSAHTRNRVLAVGGLALPCLLVALALRAPYLQLPLDRDSGLYAAIAQNMSFETLVYRDLMDHKQPLIYPVYGLIEVLAPQKVGAIRVAAAVPPAIAALLVLWALGGRVGWWRAGAGAALGLLVGASPLVQGGDLNTEHLLVMFGAAVVLTPLALERSTWRLLPLTVGVLGSLAALTKAPGVLIAPAGLIPLVGSRRHRDQSAAATAGLFLAGLAALPLLTVLGFLLLGGADDFWFGNVTYNRRYLKHVPSLAEGACPGCPDPAVFVLFLCGLALGALRLVLHRGRDTLTVTLLAWLLAAWVGAELSGRGYPHYYAPLVVPACILMCLAPAPQTVSPSRLTRSLAVTAAMAAVIVTLPFARDLRDKAGLTPFEMVRVMYGDEASNHAFEIGSAVADRAKPGDKLYVTGSEAEFYWAAGVPPATRWLFEYPAGVAPEKFVPEVRRMCHDAPEFFIHTGGGIGRWLGGCVEGGFRRYRQFTRSGPVVAYERVR